MSKKYPVFHSVLILLIAVLQAPHACSAALPTELPPYSGESYRQLVPDTYDVAERAKLAIHGLTATTDPKLDHDIYFLAVFYHNPPFMRHQFSDICIVKYFEALPLLRLMTGSKLNDHVDAVWLALIRKSIGDDGLFYHSTENRPWLQDEDMYAWAPNICWPDGTITGPRGKTIGRFADSVVIGRILAPLTIYHLRDSQAGWDRLIERMIRRISELVIEKENYAYLPARLFVPGSRIPAEAPLPLGLEAEELGGRLIQGLSQYYRVSGYEPARELAGKLVEYFRHHAQFYDAEGRFISPDGQGNVIIGGHYHGHTIGLLAILEYATAVDDKELVAFVKKSYEWARSDRAHAVAAVGWFPESVSAECPVSEICCVADMIALAIKLSEAGADDYWDDADRWVRNYFAEGQFTRVDWIDRAAGTLPRKELADRETAERVAERNLGAFTGYCTGNDYGIIHGGPTGMAACCVGNAARTLYYVWQGILQYRDNQLKVNLPLNRASPWADLHSHLPYQGQVDVMVKTSLDRLAIRLPQWVTEDNTGFACVHNGQTQSLSVRDRYVRIDNVKAGDKVTLTFPLSEQVIDERVGGVKYTYIIKGNTVVSVDPPGKFYTLFPRDHYRPNRTRWVQQDRFVPEKAIQW